MTDTAALTTLRDSLAAQGVTRVRVIHADPHGRPRSKDYPLSSLSERASGIGYCEASLVEGLDGEPLMDAPHPGGIGLPDTHAIPDATTARQVPWDPQTAWILADVVDPDHIPSGLCVRSLLKAKAYSDSVKEQLAADLRVARDIQMGMIPQDFSALEKQFGVELAAILEPTRELAAQIAQVPVLEALSY
jgi:glutamine synthetase